MLNKRLKEILRLKKGLTLLEKVHLIRKNSQTGLTLIEVLIALVITLVIFLGLMQTVLLSVDVNTANLLREEAVSIAEQRMRELRDESFAGLASQAPVPIPRNFRNFSVPYTQTVTVTAVGTDAKQINILVTWSNPKEPGVIISHSITTIKRG